MGYNGISSSKGSYISWMRREGLSFYAHEFGAYLRECSSVRKVPATFWFGCLFGWKRHWYFRSNGRLTTLQLHWFGCLFGWKRHWYFRSNGRLTTVQLHSLGWICP